jgi:hypothetical protein
MPATRVSHRPAPRVSNSLMDFIMFKIQAPQSAGDPRTTRSAGGKVATQVRLKTIYAESTRKGEANDQQAS